MTVNALSKLRNLKLLILRGSFKFSGSLNDLSNELRYILWDNYPCHCLPQSFQPHKLAKLELYGSNIEQLWEDTKPLRNLKYLDLSYCEKLVKLQNFGDAINLKILRLRGCIKLKQIDPTSGFPRNLATLNLEDSRSLINIQHFRDSLNLEVLHLKGYTKLRQLDPSIGLLKKLNVLNLEDCRSLINLPHFRDALNLERLNLKGCTKLRQIDPSIALLKKLTFLILKDCKSLVNLPNNILELNSLECLSLFGCSQLYKNQLLEEPKEAKHSKKLCIREAPSHSQSSSSIVKRCFTWLLTSFSRERKDSVNWLLPSLSIFSCMLELDLSFCNLLQVPDVIGNLHFLQRLSLMGNNFAVLPNLKELSKLINLNLQHCIRLENLPGLPSQTDVPSLNFKIFNWAEVDEREPGLNIFNCPEIVKTERCKNMCFAWMMQIVKTFHQYNHFEFDRLLWPARLSIIIGGSEIPGWFNSENVCTDNSIIIDTSHVMDAKDCLGVACSAIFGVRIKKGMDPPEREIYLKHIPLFWSTDVVTDESDHLWLFYIPQLAFSFFSNNYYADKVLKFEIWGGEGYGVEVKKYGYRVVCKEDLHLSNFTMMSGKRKFTEIEVIKVKK